MILIELIEIYFNKILSAKNVEIKDGKYVIKKPNITPQAFDVIIK